MSEKLVAEPVLPDFELPDTTGTLRRLSEIQGGDSMIALLSRGEHEERERQHHRELAKFHEWCAVAFTQLVSILPNDLHETNKLRISTGAYWTFLADEQLEVQRTLDIKEYTDPHHNATVPYTLVLAPGLVIGKVYCGYWFWGSRRPPALPRYSGQVMARRPAWRVIMQPSRQPSGCLTASRGDPAGTPSGWRPAADCGS